MTDHKGLKKRVRARMASTGEAYTTALRHVLAQAPGGKLPPGIVRGYRTFGPRQHHDAGLIAHVLEAAGRSYSEAMLCGLGGGIGFMYAVFEYTDLPPLMTIVAQHHPEPWVPAVLGRLGFGYREEHSTKPGPALGKLHAALAEGQPVFATVDRSRLPWHGLEPGFGMDPYLVVIAGHDGDLVHLDDDGAAPYTMDGAGFVAAWSAHRKGRHHAIVLTDVSREPDLPAAIRDALATTVAHLTGPVLGNTFDANFGFSGMRRLAAQLRDTRTKNGWAKRFGAPVPFFHGVRRLYECLELEYTSPGATRPVFAAFLDETASIVDGRLTEAAGLFREPGRQWSRLASLALDTVQGLGAYTEVAEQRLALIFSRGREAEMEIRELNQRLDALAGEYAAADPLGDDGRRELYADMAAIVESCVDSEREAVAVLHAVSIDPAAGRRGLR